MSKEISNEMIMEKLLELEKKVTFLKTLVEHNSNNYK